MVACKNCKSSDIVKHGIARGCQRYKCKNCGCNFVPGDKRSGHDIEMKKSLSVILYGIGKASFGFLGKLFGVSRSTAYNWIQSAARKIDSPSIDHTIREIEFDEMWHFIQSKKTKNGLSKRWIVAQGKLLPGLSVVVMLQPLNASMKK